MQVSKNSMLYAGWSSDQAGVDQAKAFIYANGFTAEDVKLQRRRDDTVVFTLKDVEINEGSW